MGISFSSGPPKDKPAMTALLRAAVERSITFFDSAEVSGSFINEKLVGDQRKPTAPPRFCSAERIAHHQPTTINRPAGSGVLDDGT